MNGSIIVGLGRHSCEIHVSHHILTPHEVGQSFTGEVPVLGVLGRGVKLVVMTNCQKAAWDLEVSVE